MYNRMNAIALAGLLLFSTMARAAEPTVADLIDQVKSGDDAAKITAIDSLDLLGHKAADAVPVLSEALKSDNPSVRAHAAQALGAMGEAAKPAVDALVQLAVSDSDEAVRRESLEALGWIHPGTQVSLPLMVQLMESKDPEARHAALTSLADQGKAAVPFLIEALGKPRAAYWACLVLGHMGPDAEEAVPALTKLLDDKRPEVRREAILALAEIGGSAVQALPQIEKALSDPHTKTAAIFACGQFQKASKEAEDAIAKDVANKDPVLGIVSAWTLARLHPDDKALIVKTMEQLCEGLKSSDPRTRKAAARALGSLKPNPDVVGPVMEKSLKGATAETIHDAIDALPNLGGAAMPQLIEALRFEKSRPYVVNLIGKQGPAAKVAVEDLAKLLDDNNPAVQHEAVIALGRIGPDAKSAVPALLKKFNELMNQGGSLSYGIAFALGRIGSPEAAPALDKAMSAPDEVLAMISAWAIVQIQPKDEASAAKALPLLLRVLKDSEPKYRRGAAEAIKLLGPLAKSAKPELQKASQDEDPAVRNTIKEALQAMGG